MVSLISKKVFFFFFFEESVLAPIASSKCTVNTGRVVHQFTGTCISSTWSMQALDGASPLWQQYSQHLSHALRFYCHLVHKMEIHFGVESSQLSELNGAQCS